MRQVLVYDSPTRLFHWLFAGFFITAFAIANAVDDDSARFSLHMLAGLGMVFVVGLRLLWSFVGTRHARLTDLVLGPRRLVAYFKGIFCGGGRLWAGHNPASSWAAVAMMGLALGLGATGWLMSTGGAGDWLEDVHELLANAFLGVVVLHLGGLVVHVLRHRDHLQAAMVTGRKQALADDEEPQRSLPVAGLGFLVLTALFMAYVLQHYDAQARTLDAFGTTMQLGEGDDADEHRAAGRDDGDDGEHG